MKLSTLMLAAIAPLLGGIGMAKGDIISFDVQGLTGPSNFGSTSEQTINVTSPGGVGVQLTGGTILTGESGNPDTSSVYATAGFAGSNYINQVTITFNQAVTNFIASLDNGSTVTNTYQGSDGLGDTGIFMVPSDYVTGASYSVYFAAAGTSVTIQQLSDDPNTDGWDYSLDNIQFDVPLPAPAPEPSSLACMAVGIWAGYFILRRRKATLIA